MTDDKKKKIYIAGAAVLLIGLGLVLFFLDTVKRYLPTEVSREPQKVMYSDFSGNQVNLYDILGEPTILYSWESTNPNARRQLTDLANLKDRYGATINIVAINRAEPLDRAKKFTDELGVTGRITLILDPLNSYYTVIGGSASDELLFVSPAGTILGKASAGISRDEVENILKKMFPGN